jgi:hypothetical protein
MILESSKFFNNQSPIINQQLEDRQSQICLVVQSSIANHQSDWPPRMNDRSFPRRGFDVERTA